MRFSLFRKFWTVSLLVFVCLIFLSVSRTDSTNSDSELEPHVSFRLHFYQPNLETYKVQAKMQSAIDCVRINRVGIILSISNYHDEFGRYVLDFIHIKKQANWTVNGIEYFNYEDEHTVDFPIFGISEFYPFDSYFLNLTFSFQDDGQITNDTTVNMECRILYGQTTGWHVGDYSNVTVSRSSEQPETVYINRQIVLRRTGWSTFPIMLILQFGFLVLGSVVLIKPSDLRVKAAIYLAMFVFFSTFYFNFLANVPKRYSLSIGENMILLLISGTALSLIFGIIQHKTSQYSESFKRTPSRQLIMLIFNQSMALAPVLLVSITLHTLFQSARGLFELYFWIDIPTGLESYYIASLMIFWIFGLMESVLLFYSHYIKKEERKEEDLGESVLSDERPRNESAELGDDEEKQRKKYINSPLLLEYEMTQQMHNYYGRISWEIASILIAGSLAMVGFSLQSPLMTKELFIGISVAFTLVMTMWLSLFRRMNQLVEIHIARLLQIEKELHFHQHTYIQEAHQKRRVIIDGKCHDLSGLRGRYSVYLLAISLIGAIWLIALLLWL